MELGVHFPSQDDKRPSTLVNQLVVAAASEAIDDELAKQCKQEKRWRQRYHRHFCAQTEAALQNHDAAVKCARKGLEELHKNMVFVSDKDCSLEEAMGRVGKEFTSATVYGQLPKQPRTTLGIPYGGKLLTGAALREQVDAWVRRGVIEISAGNGILQVSEREDWMDLSDLTFVLFGAGSAMGPFSVLLDHGAHVIALDLPRPALWKKLISKVHNSPGSMTFPLKLDCDASQYAEHAGCNLLTQPSEIAHWLLQLPQNTETWIYGLYCYLDGPMFVRIAVAMDMILGKVLEKRKGTSNSVLAYLCTPTDAHAVPAEISKHVRDNLRRAPLWQRLTCIGRENIRRKEVRGWRVVDAIVPEQGPNYLLAKRMQHWRAILMREAGYRVSANVAPTTKTASVLSNKAFAIACEGMRHFAPMEIFEQETSNTIMTLLLVNDIRNPTSVAHPDVPLENPMQMFVHNACHGGPWRCAWKYSSVGVPAALAHLTLSRVVPFYLVTYALLQTLGWICVVASSITAIREVPRSSILETLPSVTYFQTLMLLEVVHALIGLVKSSPMLTAIQILSRLMIVVHLTLARSSVVEMPWVYMTFLAWGITECVRYPYYIMQMIGTKIYALTWLRYTLFIVLYPIGVSGELGILYHTIDTIAGSQHYALQYWGTVLRLGGFPFVIIMYILCFPQLYLHMFAQRKKVLSHKDKHA